MSRDSFDAKLGNGLNKPKNRYQKTA